MTRTINSTANQLAALRSAIRGGGRYPARRTPHPRSVMYPRYGGRTQTQRLRSRVRTLSTAARRNLSHALTRMRNRARVRIGFRRMRRM